MRQLVPAHRLAPRFPMGFGHGIGNEPVVSCGYFLLLNFGRRRLTFIEDPFEQHDERRHFFLPIAGVCDRSLNELPTMSPTVRSKSA